MIKKIISPSFDFFIRRKRYPLKICFYNSKIYNITYLGDKIMKYERNLSITLVALLIGVGIISGFSNTLASNNTYNKTEEYEQY